MKFTYLLSLSLPFLLVEASAPYLYPRGGASSPCPDTRPTISVAPKTLAKHLPLSSPKRTKTCTVKGGTADDSNAILDTFKKCNNGGHVIFSEGTTYTIGKPLNLTFLKHVDWDLRGTIKFTNDTDFWQANAFRIAFQSTSTYWAIGGQDVNIFGGGLIDGGGQIWWDLYAVNSTALRPLLFNVDGLKGGTISNIRMHNPPNWFNIVQNSQDVVIDHLTLTVAAVGNPAKNTDGWDTYRSSNIVIQNSNIDNTDDCVAFKPNSTSILVQNLACNGSHGVSVGSLGQYVGVKDIAEDIYIYNVSMSNAGDAARIKVFPGAPDNVTLNSGGGSGYVKNVTYDGMHVKNVDWSIEVTGCYTVSSAALCALRPPKFLIEDVLFKNFDGVTSTKNTPRVATIICPDEASCVNIRAENFLVVSPTQTNQVVCGNIDTTTLGLNCTAA